MLTIFSFNLSTINTFTKDFIRSNYVPTIEEKLNDIAVLDEFNNAVEEVEIENSEDQKNIKQDFDKEKAKEKSDISFASIELKEELSAYNKLIIDKTKEGETTEDIDLEDFPKVKEFFESLEKLDPSYEASSTKTSAVRMFGEVKASASAKELTSRAICGYFYNPKPAKATKKISMGYVHNANYTLMSWGYHETADYATGREYGYIYDYTRPTTYEPYHCNHGSFRDHANIGQEKCSQRPCKRTNEIFEQKYWGVKPNGECNPEIHSYIWPYGEWPAYCKWWHDRN